MNHCYRTLYQEEQGTWVAVPEIAKAKGKKSALKKSALGAAIICALSLSGQAWALDANALPTGGTVSAGNGTINSSGNAMVINQGSNNMAINWQSYNIGTNASVTYHQPSSSSVALNRMIGTGASQIYGKLNANGQVFLLNSNGILFGQGAQVNVGGLVASTLNMSDQDFMNGNYRFTGTAGSVINKGTITGTNVALLGGQVSNQGTITARLGKAILAAGEEMTLDFAGDGLTSITVDKGTLNALTENKQLIQADGGTVIMTAKAADNLIQAVVNNEGIIQAQTVENQNGTIVLLSDMDNGITKVAGTLDASAQEGDGGFIETSAKTVAIQEGAIVNVGKGGNWLIDPDEITIDAAAVGTIVGTLNGGGDVTKATSDSGSDADNINIDAAISWTGTGTLILNADDDININAAITGTNGGLTLNASGTISATAPVSMGNFTLQSGTWSQIAASLPTFSATDFRIEGGTFIRALGGDGTSGNAYQLTDIYGVQGMGSSGMLGKHYALANDIDATGTVNWNSSAGFAPIGDNSNYFTGNFDGLGHTISKLTITRYSTNYVGLFGYTSGASIANVGMVDVNVTGKYSVGGLVGFIYNNSTISNSYATGTVSGNGQVGGLVGSINDNNSTISNSYATGAVSGNTDVGGLVGFNSSPISNSYATGNVTGMGNCFGGLVGYNYGYTSTISNSYATGSVTGTSDYVGGLVGGNTYGTISNSYATGALSGNWNVGGLAGGNDGGGTISNSYATGAVSGSGSVGGLVGRNGLTHISNSFWNTETTGQGDWCGSGGCPGATGLTTAQMMDASQYSSAGWDISTTGGSSAVWRIYDGYSNPLLRSFLKTTTVTAGNASRTYDGTTTTNVSHTIDGSANASLIMGTQVVATTSSKNVGTYTDATYTGLYSNQQGYDISYVNGTVEITPATLAVNAAGNKVYDGTTTASISGSNFSGLISGDSVTLTGTFADKNVGNGKTVNYGNSLSGADAGNYVLNVVSGATTANITAKTLTVTGATAADKTYDGTTNATLYGSFSGLVSGDVVTLAGTFSDKNVGSGKTVTYSNNLSGTDAGNYVLSGGGGSSTADITAKALTVTANNDSRRYDGVAYSGGNGVTYSGFVTGDDASVLGGTLAYGGSAQGATEIGQYVISASGLSANNYSINYVDGALNIKRNKPEEPYTAAVMTADQAGNFFPGRSANGNANRQRLDQLPAQLAAADNPAEMALAYGLSIVEGGIRLPEELLQE